MNNTTNPDPLDMPLPCDVTVGHGTHKKGTALRSLVLRMGLLYEDAQRYYQLAAATTGPNDAQHIVSAQDESHAAIRYAEGFAKGHDAGWAAAMAHTAAHQSPTTTERTSMNDQQIETEIQAKGLTAPRVTPPDVEANIVSEHYFTAAEGVFGALVEQHAGDPPETTVPAALPLLTFCVLVLKNGFTVTGESACASPENFDAELGRKIARANAVNKVWPLMGYALKERLAGPTATMVNRFLSWPVPADVHPDGTPGQPGRLGTNLLTAQQANEMLRHVLAG